MNLRVMIYVVLLLLSELAFAGDHYEFYQGIRQMAMGGAAIGVVDDETALALNPAGLGRLREPYITLADPVADLGSQDDQIAGGSANLPGLTDPQKALNAANNNPGAHLHGMGEIFPSLVFPNFGIGVLGRFQEDAELDAAKTAFDFEYENDFALVMGFDVRFWSGIIKLGVNGRLIDRSEISQPNINPTSTTLTTSSMLTEGMGFGTDVGLILTAPIAWLPSVSAVVRDIGRTTYDMRGGLIHSTTSTPNSTPQTVNAAFTIAPIMGKHFRSLWTVEYEDISNAWQDDVTTRHYHGGVEFNVSDFLFIRGGYNQGYWTGGIELAIQNYQIQLTSYGEEVGTSSNLQEDRRYMGGFAIRF
jgi:hypothetical protein